MTETGDVRDALARYYERRLEEIRGHAPLDEDKFIPVDELREAVRLDARNPVGCLDIEPTGS